MKVIWESGKEEHFPLFYKFVGVNKEGKRPNRVEITKEEFLSAIDDPRFKEWFIECLCKSLDDDYSITISEGR